MQIVVNEQNCQVASQIGLFAVCALRKPDADLILLNGCPVTVDQPLKDGDRVVLLRCGEAPTGAELEAVMVSRHTPEVHFKVKNRCVGIAGVGGLGSNIAVALARVGVGRLVVADFDLVEPSNLNRQHYFIDQIGLPKVLALQEILKRVSPAIGVEAIHEKITGANLCTHFSAVDVMVEAFDEVEQKTMLISHFLSNFPHIPLVAASGLAGYEPANRITTRRVAKNLYVCGDGESVVQPGLSLMAPRVGVAAHHQANAVLRLLLGEEP
ncbi:MAG: sulfur carrier protein ThiS adenylyltransferase ThiF [Deltaproteobacteria bacterium]|nr:sulfur carrier protein ThiS adenylyltransferase ThiF [Deltaproteobacteria bacterium]